MTDRVVDVGRDASIRLGDGRVLEYWDGGDPDGQPVLLHPGTPVARGLGRWAHAAAIEARVRLITISRPGYGGSTRVAPDHGLRAVGGDTAEFAAVLGLREYAVAGSSGGGPFAVATAIMATDAVRALGLIGAIGPWRDLEPATYGTEDRVCLALADAGDVQGAWDCLYRDVEEGSRRRTPAQAVVDLFRGEVSVVTEDPAYRLLWLQNMQSIDAQPAGYVFDNVAWGAAWDVDPREASAPAFLYYGGLDEHCSPHRHWRWYADRLPRIAESVVLPDARHVEIIDGHWPEVLAGLLAAWSSA